METDNNYKLACFYQLHVIYMYLYFISSQRYYFVCAGNMGGLLSFINTDDGWDFLMSKEWVRDVQVATKLYKGVAGRTCDLHQNTKPYFCLPYFSISEVLCCS